MVFLSERDRQELQKRFSALKEPVKLVYFTQELECQFCRETRQLLTEVAELSDKIKVEVYNFITDKQKSEEFAVDKIPATVVMGETKDYGIRYFRISPTSTMCEEFRGSSSTKRIISKVRCRRRCTSRRFSRQSESLIRAAR